MRLALRTTRLYLARWGLTPQKPLKKADEQSPAAVRCWIKHEWPAIAVRARAEGAEIHRGDEPGLRSDDARERSYVPAGRTPEVEVNARRRGLSIISTVTNKGQMRWKLFERALKAGKQLAGAPTLGAQPAEHRRDRGRAVDRPGCGEHL